MLYQKDELVYSHEGGTFDEPEGTGETTRIDALRIVFQVRRSFKTDVERMLNNFNCLTYFLKDIFGRSLATLDTLSKCIWRPVSGKYSATAEFGRKPDLGCLWYFHDQY